MAKQKVKIGPIDTRCVEAYPGVWEFKTGRFEWRWHNRPGMNLEVRDSTTGEVNYTACLYAKNLDHAVMFAQGFEAGRKHIAQ